METVTDNYKRVYGYQDIGNNGSLGLEIHMDIDRELTNEDEKNIRQKANELIELIGRETRKTDPATQIKKEKDKTAILKLFGQCAVFVEEIENGYDPTYFGKILPWYLVTTNSGHIKIGWRKRVIEIDWSRTLISGTSEELFPGEDVTKHEKSIHAWGYEKAQEYINVLLTQPL